MIPDRSLRILNVSQNYHVRGGMDVAMFRLEAILREHGHHVVPFAAADPANRPTDYVRYFPPAPPTSDTGASDLLRTLYSPAARRAIARVLDEQEIELVHLHSYFKRLTPAILPEIARRNIPIVQTMHEYRAVCPISLLYRDGHVCLECRDRRYGHVIRHRCAGGSLARSAWNMAEMRLSDMLGHKRDIARYLSISDYQRDQLIAMGMPGDKIETIHHPVALPPSVSTGPRDHVLFVGRLERYKGIFPLVEAARRLPAVRFVFVGDGPDADAVRASAAGLDNVEWRGALEGPALAAARASALCAVVPSLGPEPFGLTSIEALAQATPVIASAIGGLTETVRDGIDGFHVAPGDVDAICDRVMRFVAAPGLAHAMGGAGRARVATDFSPDRYYARTMSVYRDVMSGVAKEGSMIAALIARLTGRSYAINADDLAYLVAKGGISCAGPFVHHGAPVVAAAARTGTNYIDTTGEQPFIRSVFERHGAEAERSGAALISAMAFDYAPGDLLASITSTGLQRVEEMTIAYSVRGFGTTRGTALSALEMARGGDVEWVNGAHRRSDRTTGRGHFRFPSPIGARRVGRYPAGEQITVPRHVELGRLRVLIDLRTLTGVPLGPLAAPLITAGGYLMSTPLRHLLARLIARLPEGPDEQSRKAVRYTIVCDLKGGGERRRGILRGGDIYGTTAVLSAEAALRLAESGYDRRGALAPSEAFDAAELLDFLGAHGISYELPPER